MHTSNLCTPTCSKKSYCIRKALAQVFHVIWKLSTWATHQTDLRSCPEASVDDALFGMGIMAQFCSLQADTKKFNGLGKVKQEVSLALIHKSKILVAECE